MWKFAAQIVFQELDAVFPTTYGGSFLTTETTTYEQSTPDPIINDGLPAVFEFPNTSYSGTETVLQPKAQAVEYYASQTTGESGVVGWQAGAGLAISISTTAGIDSYEDANFSKLLTNIMLWAAEGDITLRRRLQRRRHAQHPRLRLLPAALPGRRRRR